MFLAELSLLGFAFFCVSGLRFLPNDTLRAEGIRLSHSSGNSRSSFSSDFSNSLCSTALHSYATATSNACVKNTSLL